MTDTHGGGALPPAGQAEWALRQAAARGEITVLVGGDRALCDLLAEYYDVQVVAVTVHHQISGLNEKFDILHATLFTTDIVSAHITSDGENSTTCNGRKRRRIIAKLFLPHELQEEHVMHYAQSTEYVELQNHDSVYLVSALQVTKRQKVVV